MADILSMAGILRNLSMSGILRNLLIVGYIRHCIVATNLPTKFFDFFNKYFGNNHSVLIKFQSIIEEELLIAGYIQEYIPLKIMQLIRLLMPKYYGVQYEIRKHNNVLYSPTEINIPTSIAHIIQPNESLQLDGLTAIRISLSCERFPPTAVTAQIIQSRAVYDIIQFLFTGRGETDCDIRKKLESAWILSKMATSTSRYFPYIASYCAIDGFVHLLRNASDEKTINHAIYGLGNMVATMPHDKYKDRIMSSGILPDIARVIDDGANFGDDIQKNAIMFMLTVFQYRDRTSLTLPQNQQLKHVIRVITKILKDNEDAEEDSTIDMLSCCLWTLFYLSQEHETIVVYLCDNGAIDICMKLLYREIQTYNFGLSVYQNRNDAMLKMNDDVCMPALRLIGNILSCDDNVTQMVLDAGFLDVVEPYLFHFVSARRMEALVWLSNILAGTHHQKEAVLSRRWLRERIVHVAATREETMECRLEAVRGIVNVAYDGTTEQKKVFVYTGCGALEALCSMLAPGIALTDENINEIIEGLRCFLEMFGNNIWNPYAKRIEECGGLEHLEEMGKNTKKYKKIIRKVNNNNKLIVSGYIRRQNKFCSLLIFVDTGYFRFCN
eukprot:514904_1